MPDYDGRAVSRSLLAPLPVQHRGDPRRDTRALQRLLGALSVATIAAGAAGLWVLMGTDLTGSFHQRALREELAMSTSLLDTASSAHPAATTLPGALSGQGSGPAPAPVEGPAAAQFAGSLGAEGEAVGTIVIPAIGLDRAIVVGTSSDALAKGPGLLVDGAVPGAPGNTTISGHRTTHGGPFRNLHKLQVGDRIEVSVPGVGVNVYEVRGTVVVDPSRVEVTWPVGGVRLTLTTCDPIGSDAKRLIVQAELIEGANTAQAIPADRWQLIS